MIEKSNLFERVDMRHHIRQSNLIESVDSPYEDFLSGLAWKYLAAKPRLSREVILTLHLLITINQLSPADAGHQRRVDVWIGGEKAPIPYTAHLKFGEWLETMRGWRNVDARQMHIKFEKIHPFVDGNGRSGRMLMWWHEIMQGKEPTLIEFDKRQDYYKWFRSAA